MPEETQEQKSLREAKERLILINNILERPEILRILDHVQVAIPFLSDIDSEKLTVTIRKFRAASAHTTMCAHKTTSRDDFSFLIDRTANLKDSICEIFDDLMFFIQFTRGIDKTDLSEKEEREEIRYNEILHIIANVYREITNLPTIEMPRSRKIIHQGTQKSIWKPHIR
jgi:hypothetical protein